MSTTMQKPADVQRQWYVVDAAGESLGHTAVAVAVLLRGKHKPTFTPNVDGGDHVIVVNCEKAVLTGKKLEQKFYRHHSGWVGGLKSVQYSKLMKDKPEKAMWLAVKGMLPDTVLGRKALTRLRAYRGPDHEHVAQKPQPYKI